MKTRTTRHLFAAATLAAALAACTSAAPRRDSAPTGDTTAAPAESNAAHPSAIIPRPLRLVAGRGSFVFDANTPIRIKPGQPGERRVAEYFAQRVHALRGFAPAVTEAPGGRGSVWLSLDPNLTIGDEAYALDVQADTVRLSARTEAGLFYGAVSLWQLATADGGQGATRIAAQRIDDAPAFVWRGLMLDVARHFRSVDEVKSVLDQMALHKLNTFHWHLTDDQGWRIEIKQYPRLTEVGGCRVLAGANGRGADGKPQPYCGYYTQEQIRDVVAYAAARHITVVPEIEMPGHAQAAIAAYPELGVTDVVRKAPRVSPDWGVHTYLFGVDDSTFTFLENVLDEVAGLFPSKYIHIGGDEAAKDQWIASRQVQAKIKLLGLNNEMALQSWFVGRIGKHLQEHDRILLGWDEILEGGKLPASTTVMSWRGDAGALEAAREGHDVVVSPDRKLYLDYVQSDRDDEPSGRFPVSTLRAFYDFQMIPPGLDAQQAKRVIGGQGNLWVEHRRTFDLVQKALYPRLDALSEVVWSPASGRDWNDFQHRLAPQFARYRAQGVQASDVAYAVDFKADHAQLALSNQAGFGEIRYRTDGAAPDAASPLYSQPLPATTPLEVVATTFLDGRALSAPRRFSAKDLSDLSARGSAALKPCREGYNLRLEDDAARDGGRDGARAALTVNLIDPCWIYPAAQLDGVARIQATVGQVPYNFQLWHDTNKIVTRKATLGGSLEVRLDDCKSTPIARLPLSAARQSDGLTTLEATLPKLEGRHDLCFVFASGGHDPLWALDRVVLKPAE
ncbi:MULTISPECIES: family 20 glycosylhydrolase [unclassified Lysobacter]|uniref:family 20 glycosylhydrolase n=1 Tax=unclassified Lysobacter TaxID=2635362 RepID=UPI001BE62981|nr:MULTISPECIES: family 20 glycosylhydrolase [unclassified Lysobacter]MBT2747230.1 family 20 glycosylhydrolase [Lysobacter sp. ISL-42]MBT2750266.1 family 20 glycosylhydrolase [Lysobacter sp. ISL-50]MBT2777768.1 family 20 glycosylhydrolase [Lysobacter sp. ISL-54]MBT2783704.1 family 20 glycosylhydrolase [Lysobacter sp. ISL-52]